MIAVQAEPNHFLYRGGPTGWTALLSRDEDVRRLLVFVHGWNGHSMKTWRGFSSAADYKKWWNQTDLVFFGYNSVRESIGHSANKLSAGLPSFYPHPPRQAICVNGQVLRANTDRPYGEIMFIGHSQGCVVIRRAQVDAAQRWDAEGRPPHAKPILLCGPTRLFSPAQFGMQLSGPLAIIRAAGPMKMAEMALLGSPSYNELQKDSVLLRETRMRTESLAQRPEFRPLRAKTAFAEREEIVCVERYTTDEPFETVSEATHTSVCKPILGRFEAPWDFVERGTLRGGYNV